MTPASVRITWMDGQEQIVQGDIEVRDGVLYVSRYRPPGPSDICGTCEVEFCAPLATLRKWEPTR